MLHLSLLQVFTYHLSRGYHLLQLGQQHSENMPALPKRT